MAARCQALRYRILTMSQTVRAFVQIRDGPLSQITSGVLEREIIAHHTTTRDSHQLSTISFSLISVRHGVTMVFQRYMISAINDCLHRRKTKRTVQDEQRAGLLVEYSTSPRVQQ